MSKMKELHLYAQSRRQWCMLGLGIALFKVLFVKMNSNFLKTQPQFFLYVVGVHVLFLLAPSALHSRPRRYEWKISLGGPLLTSQKKTFYLRIQTYSTLVVWLVPYLCFCRVSFGWLTSGIISHLKSSWCFPTAEMDQKKNTQWWDLFFIPFWN